MAAVLAFPRVWLAAILAGLIVAYALWALIGEGQELLWSFIIMIAIATLLFLAMLGAIAMRRRRAR